MTPVRLKKVERYRDWAQRTFANDQGSEILTEDGRLFVTEGNSFILLPFDPETMSPLVESNVRRGDIYEKYISRLKTRRTRKMIRASVEKLQDWCGEEFNTNIDCHSCDELGKMNSIPIRGAVIVGTFGINLNLLSILIAGEEGEFNIRTNKVKDAILFKQGEFQSGIMSLKRGWKTDLSVRIEEPFCDFVEQTK